MLEQLWRRPDPFLNLSSQWLAGGKKGIYIAMDPEDEIPLEELDPEDGEKREQELQEEIAEKIRFEEEEQVRLADLREANHGHIAWLRGRELRCELVLAKPRPEMKPKEEPLRKVPARDVWFRAPLPVQTGGETKVWCWAAHFVNEARHIATGRCITFATIESGAAHKVVHRQPEMRKVFRGHVVALSSDGRRELWSPNFVQLLGALFETWQMSAEFSPKVRMSEDEFQRATPEVTFDVMCESLKPPKRPEALRVAVPPELTGIAPPPPPLPDRLPCRLPYELNEPWTRILSRSVVSPKNITRNLGRIEPKRLPDKSEASPLPSPRASTGSLPPMPSQNRSSGLGSRSRINILPPTLQMHTATD